MNNDLLLGGAEGRDYHRPDAPVLERPGFGVLDFMPHAGPVGAELARDRVHAISRESRMVSSRASSAPTTLIPDMLTLFRLKPVLPKCTG